MACALVRPRACWSRLLVACCCVLVAVRRRRRSPRSTPRSSRSSVADDSDARVDAVRKLVASERSARSRHCSRRSTATLALIDDGKRAVIVSDGKAHDAVTRRPAGTCPTKLEDVVINNRMRGELDAALAALRLGSPNRAVRLAAAKELARTGRRGRAAADREGAGSRKPTRRSRPCSRWPALRLR